MRKDRERHRQGIFEKHITMTGRIKKAVKILTEIISWIPKIKDFHEKTKTKRSDILTIATTFYEDI